MLPLAPFPFSIAPSWTTAIVALHLITQAAQSASQPRDFQKPVPPVAERLNGPAHEAANLSPRECRARLKKADSNDVFKRQGPTSGIANPLRITKPIAGVEFQVPAPKFSYGRLDCRLALVLLQLAPVLKDQGVESVRIDSFYRHNARLARRRARKSQHSYGLAIDLISFRAQSKEMTEPALLTIAEDFHGRRGEPPCGPKAKLHLGPDATAEDLEQAVLLRDIVCKMGREGFFHHILTPNYNQAHESHLHLDIQRDNRWFSLD